MKRVIAHWSMVVVLGLAALVCTAGPVWADSPHFIGDPTATLESNGSVDVKFKEAGLGLGQTDYLVEADVAVSCVCATNNDSCPNADNKSNGTFAVSQPASFSPKHGTVSQTINLPAPGCPASLQPTCGKGQHFELVDLSWTDIAIGDCTNSVPAGTTCTGGDLTGGLATAPASLAATGLFVCKH